MRKALIISPRFPPNNAPDLHRVRTSLPYYRCYGWDPVVLCLTSDCTGGAQDPLLAEGIPKDVTERAGLVGTLTNADHSSVRTRRRDGVI